MWRRMITLSFPQRRMPPAPSRASAAPALRHARALALLRSPQARHAARRGAGGRRLAHHRLARTRQSEPGLGQDDRPRREGGRGDGLHPEPARRRPQVEAQPDGRGAGAAHLGGAVPAHPAGADRVARRRRLPADPRPERLRPSPRGGPAPDHDRAPPGRHRRHRPGPVAGGARAAETPRYAGGRDLGPERSADRHAGRLFAPQGGRRGRRLLSRPRLAPPRHRHGRRPPGVARCRPRSFRRRATWREDARRSPSCCARTRTSRRSIAAPTSWRKE